MTATQTTTSNEALRDALADIAGQAEIIGTGGGCEAIEVRSTRRSDAYLLVTDGDASLPLYDGKVTYGIYCGAYETATDDPISDTDDGAVFWVNLEADDPEHTDSKNPIDGLLAAVRTWNEA